MPWLCFKSWTHHLAFMLTSISVKCLVTAPLTFSQVALKSPTIPILKSWVDEFFHQFINHNSLKPKTSILVVGLVDSQVALTHSVYVVVSAGLSILHVPHLHHYLVHLARTTPPSLSWRALQLYDQNVCRCFSSTAVLSILGLRSLLTVPTCT